MKLNDIDQKYIVKQCNKIISKLAKNTDFKNSSNVGKKRNIEPQTRFFTNKIKRIESPTLSSTESKHIRESLRNSSNETDAATAVVAVTSAVSRSLQWVESFRVAHVVKSLNAVGMALWSGLFHTTRETEDIQNIYMRRVVDGVLAKKNENVLSVRRSTYKRPNCRRPILALSDPLSLPALCLCGAEVELSLSCCSLCWWLTKA